MTNFQFPLEGTSSYKGKIKFKAIREDYQTVLDRAITASDTFLSNNTTVSTVTEPGGSSAPAGGGRGFGTSIEPGGLPAPIGSSIPLATRLDNFYKGVGSRRTQASTRFSLDTAILYLPNQINFRDAAEYQNVNLGMIGGGTALALREGATGAQMLLDAARGSVPSFEDLQEAFVNGLRSEAAQVAALRTVGRVSEGVGGAIETETGITLNPNRRSTFKGIGLRRFNFSFQLIPTSAAEALRIKEIIGFFRHNMYPDIKGQIGSIDGVSAAFTFPSKFEISMVYGKKRVGTMTLPMFLEHVNVTYNPNSMAFHSDGEPQETVIDLAFIEERALTKPDIVKDHIKQNLAGKYKS